MHRRAPRFPAAVEFESLRVKIALGGSSHYFPQKEGRQTGQRTMMDASLSDLEKSVDARSVTSRSRELAQVIHKRDTTIADTLQNMAKDEQNLPQMQNLSFLEGFVNDMLSSSSSNSSASRHHFEPRASSIIAVTHDDDSKNPIVKLDEVCVHPAGKDASSSSVAEAAMALVSLPSSIANSSSRSLSSTSSSSCGTLNTRNKNGIPIRCPHIHRPPARLRPLTDASAVSSTNKASTCARRQQMQRVAALRRRRFGEQELRRIFLFQQRALSALIRSEGQERQQLRYSQQDPV